MPDFVNHIYPSKTAVLVINMSNGFVSPGALNYVDSGHRFAPELGRFLDRCRRQKIAVIYAVQAYRPDGADLPRNIRRCSWSRNCTACIDGTWECEIYEPCAPSESDIIIKKQHYDAFHQTDLAVVLQASQIDTIAIAGVCTDVSCLYTARGAFYRNYKIIVLEDLTGTKAWPGLGYGSVSEREQHLAAINNLSATNAQVMDSKEFWKYIRTE